jgi:hypothetical protein
MAGSTSAPVGAGGFEQQVDLVAVERDVGRLEQLAVEARQDLARRTTENRLRPFLATGLRRGDEVGRALPCRDSSSSVKPRFGQQADVFGEHGEQAAGEKAGDALGVVAGASSVLAMPASLLAISRVARAAAGWVERERVEPDGFEAGADFFVARSSSRMRCERGSGNGV